MSNTEKKTKIPQPPAPAGSTGNLLSSVAPPSQLPNFVTVSPIAPVTPNVAEVPTVAAPAAQPVPIPMAVPVQPIIVKPRDEHAGPQGDNSEKFSPAIPLSKGEPTLSIRSPEDSQTTQSPDSLSDSTPEMDKLGDILPGSGLITWMKGAVATGGILHRVAEKAKSSVDSVITTLDPQMKEYLKSGGDMLVVVASDKEVKISPVREAFQTVFGNANVVGYPAQSDVTATQPVGYAAAYAAAKQRIAHVRSVHGELHNNIPVIAVEGFLHESVTDSQSIFAITEKVKMTEKPKRPMSAYMLWLNSAREQMKSENPGMNVTDIVKKGGEIWKSMKDKREWEEKAALAKEQYAKDLESYQANGSGGEASGKLAQKWYDVSLIILSHPSLGIELQLQSQGTPVPSAAVEVARTATPEDYPHSQTGFSVTIGSIMGDSLQVPHTQWQEASTGVSRRDLLLLATLSIAGSYKRLLAISAAET